MSIDMESRDHSSENLRSELARLQDREASLTHLLNLERERRVRAEHLVEVERLACFQLGHRLARQKSLHSTEASSQKQAGSLQGPDSEAKLLANCDGHHSGVCDNTDTETVECSIDFEDTRNNRKGANSVSEELKDNSFMSASLTPLSGEDFASSIFNQLPADLQHMLGVADTQDTGEEALSNAMAAVKSNDPDQLRKCISSPGLRNPKGTSLLEVSCERGHEGCVRVLLEGGWNPNEVGNHAKKWTPLHICAKKGHLGSLKVLLEFGADPNSKDNSDQTPLLLSLRGSHEATAQALMEAGTSLDLVTKEGLTVLHAAVLGNIPHTLRLLLAHLRASLEGSKFKQILNSPDSSGRTALHLAVSGGHRECVGVLCACEGVGLTQRDRWNRTPMDVTTDEELQDLLRNRESRPVVVCVQSPDLSNGHQKRLIIGQVSTLPHHRLSDVQPLVADLLSHYNNSLKALSLYSSMGRGQRSNSADVSPIPTKAQSLSERVQTEYELASALKDGSISSLRARKEDYLQNCLKTLNHVCGKVSSLGLSSSSVASYQVGLFSWRHGELDKGASVKTLFSVFSEAQLRDSGDLYQINITLKGPEDGCLDQLAFELMIPVAKLQEYTDLVEQHRALIIHGPPGSGKTQLARTLANHIKGKKKERTQVVYVSLHPSFQRDDLFRLLHLNGLLTQHKDSRRSSKSHIIILDDLSAIHTPSVLAELLTSLEYRGAENPMWVNDVYGRDGSLLYQCGHYYLSSSSYFIATKSSERVDGETASVDQFAHISLGLHSCSGVLTRHFSARLIHAQRGVPLHATLPLCRLVCWVIEVWVLYNNFVVERMGLPQLAVGVRHFVQCPVESGDLQAITSWLVSLWTHHLVPALSSTLITTQDDQDVSKSQLVSKFLVACSEMVFRPTCPLSYEHRERFLERLREVLEGEVTGRKVAGTHREEEGGPSSHPNLETESKGTPPTNHSAHKPPHSPQHSSMVSYEDMLRDSPRNKAKSGKNRSHSTKSTKSMTLDRRADKPPLPVEPVILRPNPRRNKTLRKLRAKTISLFSKDDKSSTLPSLFRRGSRSSLINDPAESTPSDSNPAKEAKQLEDMFNLLSTANSTRFEDQRSPSPPPKVSSEKPVEKKKDLDDFLDMLSSVSSKRIDEQRSPPPKILPNNKCSKKEVSRTVPRYMLPTGSPLREAHKENPNKLLGVRGTSPPMYSSPDLLADVDSDRGRPRALSHPVQRKFTNTSFSSYDSDRSGTNYSAADIVDEVHRQPQSKQDSKLFRGRAKTFHSSSTSEPVGRRKPLHNLVIESSARSTPPSGCSPASPLTMTTHSYSSPRGSPTTQYVGESWELSRGGIGSSIRAKSVNDILEVDELGDIDDFDLFRAASEGELMQSSGKESFLDFRDTQNDSPEDHSDKASVQPINYGHVMNGRPSYAYQSSLDEGSQTGVRSFSRVLSDPHTSGYGSDGHMSDFERKRSYSTSTSHQSYGYHTTGRRYSQSSGYSKDLSSPTNSLTHGRRQSSDASSVIGSNLLYSASLGFNSLPRLNSSRDHLSTVRGSLTEDLTEM